MKKTRKIFSVLILTVAILILQTGTLGIEKVADLFSLEASAATTVTTAAQFQAAVTANATAIVVNATITSSAAALFSDNATHTITVNSGYTLTVSTSGTSNAFARSGSYSPNFVFNGAGKVVIKHTSTTNVKNAIYTPGSLTISGGVSLTATNATVDGANAVSAGNITINTTGSVFIGCTSSAMNLVGRGGLYCNGEGGTKGITIKNSGKVYVAGYNYGIHQNSASYGGIYIGGSATVYSKVTNAGGYAIRSYGHLTIEGSAKVYATATGSGAYGMRVHNFFDYNIKGTASVTSTATKYPVYGHGSLNVSGGASLTVASTENIAQNAINIKGDINFSTTGTIKATVVYPTSNTIYCDGSITIDGGTHYYGCTSATGAVTGGYGMTSVKSGSVKISGATVYAKGLIAGIRSIDATQASQAILLITDSTVVADAVNTESSYGLYSSGNCSIAGGSVTSSGYYGIYCLGKLSMNCPLTASGDMDGLKATDIAIRGSTVNANGTNGYGIYTTNGTLSVYGCTVNANGAKGAIGVQKNIRVSGNAVLPQSVSEAKYELQLRKNSTLSKSASISDPTINVIRGIKDSVTVSDVLVNFANETVSAKTASNAALSGTTYIATGDIIALDNYDSLVAVINGDTTGDGRVTAADYLKMKLHQKGDITLTGVYLDAADVNGDGTVSVADYIAVKTYFRGGAPLASFNNSNINTAETVNTSGFIYAPEVYTVDNSLATYVSEANALNATGSTGAYLPGDYYVYSAKGSILNLTKDESGSVPGAWVDTKLNEFSMNLYKGEVHAHTTDSDGTGTVTEAYAYAKANGADFFSVTDHSNSSSQTNFLTSQIPIANGINENDIFTALYGYELTYNYATGYWGHLNVINGLKNYYVRSTSLSMTDFYSSVVNDPDAVVQFNHPGYRWGNFEEYAHYSTAIDKSMGLSEIKGSSYDFEYMLSLSKGWHISPIYNEDNHSGSWTTASAYIGYALAERLTRDDIVGAMQNNRTYTTGDPDLKLYYKINGSYMGSTLNNPSKLRVEVDLSTTNALGIGTVYLMAEDNIVVASKAFSTNKSAKWDFELDAEYDYYYIKVSRSGSFTLTGPIWIDYHNAIQITSMTNGTVKGSTAVDDHTATVSFKNLTSGTLTDVTVDFYRSAKTGFNITSAIPYKTVNVGNLAAGSSRTVTEYFPYVAASTRRITAVVSGYQNGMKYSETLYTLLTPIYITEVVPLTATASSTANPYEYIELYNNTNQDINLSSWALRYWPKHAPEAADLTACTLNLSGATIKANSTLVIWLGATSNTLTVSNFNSKYGVSLSTSAKSIFLAKQGILLPDANTIQIDLLDASGDIVNRVYYNMGDSFGADVTSGKAITYKFQPVFTDTSIKVSAGVTPTPGSVTASHIPQ